MELAGGFLRITIIHYVILMLSLGSLTTACNQSNFGTSGYKKGENRDSGDHGKDQVMQNSAFGNAKDAETSPTDPRIPSPRLTTSIKVKSLCSNAWTQNAGTNARRASAIVASIVPVTPGQSDLRGPLTVKARSGNVVHLDDSSTSSRLHQEITTTGQFKLSLVEIPDGDYQLTLCDGSMQQACQQNPAPSTSGDRYLFVGIPGQVGTAIMNVQQGQLTKIQSTGTADGKSMLVLMDGNSSIGNADCDQSASPLIIDIANVGIDLSSPAKGVNFDVDADGIKDTISWPLADSSVFLALDINKNGLIENGSELFGNNSIGPDGKKSDNGFLALSKYDDNHDGVIDAKDACFKRLLLWSDKDRNGLTAPNELMPLETSEIESIDLSYKEGYELDQYGNSTRQRSVVKLKDGKLRLIVDIWFRKNN